MLSHPRGHSCDCRGVQLRAVIHWCKNNYTPLSSVTLMTITVASSLEGNKLLVIVVVFPLGVGLRSQFHKPSDFSTEYVS